MVIVTLVLVQLDTLERIVKLNYRVPLILDLDFVEMVPHVRMMILMSISTVTLVIA